MIQGCSAKVLDVRGDREQKALIDNGVFPLLKGVLALQHLNYQGNSKIGGSVGTFGDCQHYCMPGIPDVLARALFTLLVTTKE